MKVIIGLGNPGKEYAMTRHNAGFLCIDFLKESFGFESFAYDKKMSADISVGIYNNEKILLVKPTTFMNNSGVTASTLIQFYKLSPADIIVIHDDLDIDRGTYKITLSSRPAGHNGVTDIIEKLGTQDFFRIRLGIGRPLCLACKTNKSHTKTDLCTSAHTYVLETFSTEEYALLQTIFPKAKEEIIKHL